MKSRLTLALARLLHPSDICPSSSQAVAREKGPPAPTLLLLLLLLLLPKFLDLFSKRDRGHFAKDALSLSLSSIPSFLLEALDLDTINNEVDGLGNSLPPLLLSLSLSSSPCEKQLSEASSSVLLSLLRLLDGECELACVREWSERRE